jgi:hypothetical protein
VAEPSRLRFNLPITPRALTFILETSGKVICKYLRRLCGEERLSSYTYRVKNKFPTAGYMNFFETFLLQFMAAGHET